MIICAPGKELMATSDESLKVLLGLTGSVASIKAVQLVQCLKSMTPRGSFRTWERVEVRVIATERARHFFDQEAVGREADSVHYDQDEWKWKGRGDPVLHIELTKWADVFVVAPADALTVSKLAHGHCDNLLSCALLAWPRPKPLVVCPSMNTKMWEHPAVRRNVRLAREWCGAEIVGPISKRLMCGDLGVGAMQEPAEVADAVVRVVTSPRSRSRSGGFASASATTTATFGAGLVVGAIVAWGLVRQFNNS